MQPGANPGLMFNNETIPMKDFMGGRTATVEQLTQDRPGLRSFFTAIGESSETPINLEASLTLFIASPGIHYMGESDATAGGKPASMAEFNIGSFDLSN